MQTLILTLHIIVCFLLVILVLLQSGKEGMGVIFGGGNSSVFGSAGAGGILAKLTAFMAVVFVITSLSYTYVTSSRPDGESQILNVQIEDAPQAAPDAAKSAPSVAPPDAAKPSGGQGSAAPSAAPNSAPTPDSAPAQNSAPAPDSAPGQQPAGQQPASPGNSAPAPAAPKAD